MIKIQAFWSIWKKITSYLNSHGIPMPMVRDPKTGKGSVTATLVVASSGICIVSIILMLGVFIAKTNRWFILNDDTLESLKSAFDSSFDMLLASLAAYLGRKWQGDKGTVLESNSTNNVPAEK